MEELSALLNGKLGGGEALPPELGGLQNAQQLWTMLDDMSQNDPDSYAAYIAEQLATVKKDERAALPTPCFCARVHVSEPPARAGPLFINACSHHSMKPPNTPDGPVTLAISVLRDTTADAALAAATAPFELAPGHLLAAVDVITSEDQLARARRDAAYRRELCDLFVECVEETHGLRIKRGSARILAMDVVKYAGGEVARFRDARDRMPAATAAAPRTAPVGMAVGGGPGAPARGSLMEQLAAVAGAPQAPTHGARASPRPAGAESADGGALSDGLRLPGGAERPSSSPGLSGPHDGDAVLGPARPLIQELTPAPALALSEPPAEPAEPAYELLLDARTADGSAAVTLHVQLPTIASARELELSISARAIELASSCGACALKLRLPAQIDSEHASSKFDRKRRVLTIIAPLIAVDGRAAAD